MKVESAFTSAVQQPELTGNQPPVNNPVYRLGKLVTGKRGRWVVLIVWILLTGLMSSLPPKLSSLYDDNLASDIGDQESVRASKLLEQAFPDRKGLPAIIAFYNPSGLTDSDFATAQKVSDWLVSGNQPAKVGQVLSIYTVPQSRSQLVSANGTTMTMIVSLNILSSSDKSLTDSVKAIRAFTDPLDGHGSSLQVKVTGAGGVAADAQLVFTGTDVTLLLTTVALVLVLLIVIYRSPVLALLPLIAVGITQSVIGGILALAVKANLFGISQMDSSIMTILLFGAGTDYTIFLISRYREELHSAPDRLTALRNAYFGVASAILSSAGTVIAALLVLLLAIVGIYHSLGPSLATAIAVMLIAGLTLVPALLAILGSFAFWPFRPDLKKDKAISTKPTFWGKLARQVSHHPLVAVLGSLVFLLILSLGNLGVNEVYNFLTGFRQPTASASGYKILANNFEPGALAPFDVVIQLKDGTNAYQKLVEIDQISQAIATNSNVAMVSGPTRPDGKTPSVDPASLQQQFATLPPALTEAIRSGKMPTTGSMPGGSSLNPQIIGLYAQTISYISPSNTVVRLQITLKSDPYGVPALDSVSPIRTIAKQATQKAGLGENVSLTGMTAQLDDTRQASDHDKLIVIPLVILLTGLILGLLLRSLVAPLFLLAAVLLNFFAALGISSFLFTTIQGDDGLSYATPLYAFIFLVALGADYTIFLMSRVREEVAKLGLVEGTQKAVTNTGGVITSAGIILAGTFLVLTTLPLRDLYQLGIVVAVGILLDTFIVRGLLVPGVVLLLGDATWWPGKRLKTK
ncbi:MAG: MMPL family transporter [Chloroflexi bacterium]|uniref:MMPL family transporter n=1 Tax=Candidatus Chlorohelix allophototropha TaxID=3003348 RepID=A0A8T7LYJ9_9CHLR|nr:MMPL family transporter [Chloroflexota bacterium]WJW66322.1 MMPL family transporter [Chloroflexota bacterium L227-S17]